jgi:hypothetical protein
VCDSKSSLSFSMKGHSCKEWKVGNQFGSLGSSKMYVEV